MTATTKTLGILLASAIYIFGCWLARGGDTYACVNSSNDYINYGPAAPSGRTEIVVAVDSARYEQRWQPMLDSNQLERLIFIEARNRPTDLTITTNP